VVAADSEKVIWKDYRGYISSGSPDFTFRRSEQESRSGRWKRQFSPRNDLFFVPETSLWPLVVGKVSGFREDGKWTSKKNNDRTYTSYWRFEVKGTERVSVLAGDFDTWKIVGYRYSNKRKYTRKVKEIKTWYYAPEVGHPVLITRRFKYNRPKERLGLTAIIPPVKSMPNKAVKGMQQSFQQCLESNKSGTPTAWGEEGSDGSGIIIPLDTLKLKSGKYCRHYRQEVWIAGEKRYFYGIAVRVSKDRWVIPRKKIKK
jgi:phosphoribosyl-AMP cyclohydrolase